MTSTTQADNGCYSPPIKIELHLNGETFNVASTGPDRIILRDARKTHAGEGILRVTVDGQETDYSVNVLNGIDPNRTHQPVSIISVQSEAAA